MQDLEMLARLRQTWPESTDYLARVGQANNDLSVLRELAQRETYEAQLSWLDQMAVSVEDLTQRPNAANVMSLLFSEGTKFLSATEVLEYKELSEAHRADQLADLQEWQDPNDLEHLLETPGLVFSESLDEALWALPELQESLLGWATLTAERHGHPGQMTLAQAWILFRVCLFLEAEPEQSPEWAAECLQSALSSEFFKNAGSRAQ